MNASQSALPQGGTLLGVVLSSDKTNISAATGDRVAHPLLLTLANLSMDVRMKSTYHALPLLALLPCPKFIRLKKPLHGIMENRCHELAFFTFFSPYFSQTLTNTILQILSCHPHHTRSNPFRLLTLFQTIKKIESACIRTKDVANTTLKLQRSTRFETRPKPTGYLIVRENDRTSDPL